MTAAFSYPKERRLRKRAEIVRVQTHGVRVHTAHFVLLVSCNDFERARFGVTVTRRVGNAVERNRVKRVVRESFRRSPGIVPPGIDLLAIAKAGAPSLGFTEVGAELRGASAALRKHAARILSQRRTSQPERPAENANSTTRAPADTPEPSRVSEPRTERPRDASR